MGTSVSCTVLLAQNRERASEKGGEMRKFKVIKTSDLAELQEQLDELAQEDNDIRVDGMQSIIEGLHNVRPTHYVIVSWEPQGWQR